MSAAAERRVAVWDRLLTSASDQPTPDHARYLLRLGFTAADHERTTELGPKANEGTLTEDELAELDDYILVGHILIRLHAFDWIALRGAARESGCDPVTVVGG